MLTRREFLSLTGGCVSAAMLSGCAASNLPLKSPDFQNQDYQEFPTLALADSVTEEYNYEKATAGSAGLDLTALETMVIPRGETFKFTTGIALHIKDPNYAGFIMARSGMATKKGLAPANKVGLIDSDYQGPIIVALHNHSNISQTVYAGDRIAQLVILPVVHPQLVEVEIFGETTERGAGGFGSTD